MEEELNKQNPEVNSEPKMPKKSKKKFIIIGIIVVLVLVIAAVVFGVCTGRVNFTKKSKLFSAISKAQETINAPLDALMTSEPAQIADNLAGSDVQYTAEITGSIDSLEGQAIESAITSEQIETIKSLVNGAKIGVDFKVDPKDKAMEGNIKVGIENLLDEIQANVIYNNNAIAISLPDFSEKYLAVFGDTVQGTEYAELAQVFEAIESMDLESTMSSMTELGFTEEEIKHFEDTYDGLFKEQIESDMIETESGKIEVDGKDKSCTKVILTLKDKDVKNILKAYIDAFESDDEGKKIIAEKIAGFSGILSSQMGGTEVTADSVETQIDELVSQLKDSLDSIAFDGEIVVTAYSTLLNTYALDIEYSEDSNSAVMQLVFGKEGTDLSLEVNDQEMFTGKIVDEKEKKSLQLNVDQSGVKADVEIGVNLKSDTESEFFLKGSAEQNGTQIGTVDFSANSKVTKNEKEEYASETALKCNLDVPNQAKVGFTINIKESMKVADVTVQEINRTNAIDVLGTSSQTELQNYLTEITPKLEEVLTKVQSSELYKAIEEMSTSSGTGTTIDDPFDYGTYTNTTTDYNSTMTNTYDYNSTMTNTYDFNSTMPNTYGNSVYSY